MGSTQKAAAGRSIKAFTDPEFGGVLAANGLKTFADLWGLERNWVQPVNTRRGGTSGVCRRMWRDTATGEGRAYYIKYQENHFCRGWIPLLRTFPVSRREAKNILVFESGGIPTMKLVYHHEKKIDGKLRTILVTEEVKGIGLKDYLKIQAPDERLIQALAQLLADVHCKLRYVHRAFNIDHLIVNDGRIYLIDLELARPRRWSRRPPMSDVATLFGDLKKCKVTKEICGKILEQYAMLMGKEQDLGKWSRMLKLA